MENKKGEIATLLTLSLLVIGTVATLVTSYFTNKQKISTNLKAASVCPTGVVRYGLYNCTPSQICGSYSNYVPNSQVIEGSIRKVCCYNNSTPANPSTCTNLGVTGPIPTITPNPNAPSCKSGTYTTLTGCEVVCGINNCRSCKLGSTIKYECKVSSQGLPPCGNNRTYVTQENCKKENPNGICTQCLLGSSVRYELGGSGPTQAPYKPPSTPTPTPEPGTLGGDCKNRTCTESGGVINCKGTCYGDLVCDSGIGKCRKPKSGELGGVCKRIEAADGKFHSECNPGLVCDSGTCITPNNNTGGGSSGGGSSGGGSQPPTSIPQTGTTQPPTSITNSAQPSNPTLTQPSISIPIPNSTTQTPPSSTLEPNQPLSPTYASTPTPPLLSETGIWANPGLLVIENAGNDNLRLIAISLVEYLILSIDLPPRKSYDFDFGKYCNFFRRRFSGHLAYYSSSDDYRFARFKSLDLSCNSHYVISIQ